MTHSKLKIQGLIDQPQQLSSSARAQIIDQFLSIKQKSSALNRETIFTALAIFQKYMLKRTQKHIKNQEKVTYRQVQIAACLWMSIKIQSHEKRSLTKILHLYQIPIQKQQIIQAEAQILQIIDFQVPLYHTYASMILEFNKRSDSILKNNFQLVAQCLAFYGEAIKLSSDFVLQEELGGNIVACLADRCITDSRIRSACRSIRRNRNSKNQSVNVQNKNNITIKVYE